LITKEIIVLPMITRRIVLICPSVYLCVVVKELAESCHPGHYTRMICLGKLFSNQVAGGPLFPALRDPPRHFSLGEKWWA